jgi:branched-chain amino acid transport system permease protein
MKRTAPYLVLAALVLLPLMQYSPVLRLGSDWMHVIIMAIMWTVTGMAWNLLGGYCGQVSFGHAAFFGMGSYCAALMTFHFQASPWWGFLVSIPATAAIAMIMGFLVLRLRGPYFVLATLAIGEVMRITFENLVDLTNGTKGITIVRDWVDKTPYYCIILGLAVGTYLLIKRMIGSKWGYYFVAVREDQDAAESLGIDTTRYKTIALVVSAILTGLAGAFYTVYMGYIDPQVVFSLGDISILIIMVVMVGGVATFWGPAVGAVIMIALSEYIRTIPYLGTAYQTFFGILLIVIIIYLPNGLVGDYRKLAKLFTRKTPGAA